MIRILFWIAIVFALLFGLRLLNVAKAKRRSGAAQRGPAAPPETMVRCSRCGVYLPQKDAIPGRAGQTCGDPACRQQD